MAYMTTAVGRDGRTYFTLRRYVGGRVKSEGLGAIDPAEAARILAAVNAESTGGRGRSVTGSDAVDGFLKHLRATRRRERTVSFYEHHMRRFVAHMGVRPWGTWTRADLEGYLAERTGWSSNTVCAFVRALRTWIKWGRSGGYSVNDFTRSLPLPKRTHHMGVCYTPEELGRILAAADDSPVRLPVYLATYAGLPLGDLRTLTWAEVDLEAGRIARTRGRAKTGERMALPIAPPLAEVLKANRAVAGLVCRYCGQDERMWLYALHAVLRRAKVARAGWHALRRSYATAMSALGADVATVGALLGHRPGSPVTLRYLVANEDRKAAAITSLAAAIRPVAREG